MTTLNVLFARRVLILCSCSYWQSLYLASICPDGGYRRGTLFPKGDCQPRLCRHTHRVFNPCLEARNRTCVRSGRLTRRDRHKSPKTVPRIH